MIQRSGNGWRDLFVAPPTENRQPLPASGRAGRNMPAAVTSAVILLLALGTALFLARPVFLVFVAILILVGDWEVAGAFARRQITVLLPPLYLGTIAMIVAAALGGSFWIMAALYFGFVVAVIWRLADSSLQSRPVMDIMATAFAFVYLPFAGSFFVLMSVQSADVWPIFFFVVIVACNDLGGWLAGVLFGKHPMAPRLSPKKSWEGFAGSVLACVGAALVATFVLDISWWWCLVLGLSAAVIGTLGDLTESLIKREVGLKDMSDIVPGHGGVMDRLDSMLFTAPAFYFYFALALGWW